MLSTMNASVVTMMASSMDIRAITETDGSSLMSKYDYRDPGTDPDYCNALSPSPDDDSPDEDAPDDDSREDEAPTLSTWRHPAYIRAARLSEPLRSHFPQSLADAQKWTPLIRRRALAGRVLVVARTRIECMWKAYIDAVPGINHDIEAKGVLAHGATLDEAVARVLFPEFDEVPYAE
jgi:hypothetical protein